MSRRNDADWRNLIKQFEASGLSAAEFCRRNELNPKYFSTRRVALRKRDSMSRFVEAKPVATSNADAVPVTVRIVKFVVPLDQLSSVLSSLR